MKKILLPKCEIEKTKSTRVRKNCGILNEWFEKELNGYKSSKNVMTIPSGGTNE